MTTPSTTDNDAREADQPADGDRPQLNRQRLGPIRRTLARVLGTLAALTLLASLLGFLGQWAWWLDVLNEPRMPYLGLGILCLLMLLLVRAWGWAVVALLAVAVNAWLVLPWVLGDRPTAPAAADHDLRLMVLNVHVINQDFGPVTRLLEAQRPDVVVLNEVDQAWLEHVRAIDTGYTLYDTPTQGRFGVLLMARGSVESVRVEQFTDRWSKSVVARLRVNGREAALIATHPPAPLGPQTWENRNEHLRELAAYARGLDVPVLVAGDLNTTMWSPHFDMLLQESGLAGTRDGFGVLPTYPATWWGVPVPWALRVPLDHVLASEEWAVFDCAAGPNVGSDHLPLTVNVSLRPIEE